jgi:acetyl-CoA carboxylase biotin carboxylase subunit
VPLDYDPLLAKLIGYGSDRKQTIMRLRRALHEYFVGGIKTNLSLFRSILKNPEFMAGKLDTGFLDRLLANPETDPVKKEHPEIAAISAGVFAVLEQAPASRDGASGISAAAQSKAAATGWKQAGRVESLQ